MVTLARHQLVPEVWALVPARSGSKSIVDKNLQMLQGHSLLAWSIVAGVGTKGIERTFLSSDSAAYGDVAARYGACVPFVRPPDLASDNATDVEVFTHFINWALNEERAIPELIVHLRPTTPTRDLGVLSRAVEYAWAEKESATAVRSVHVAPESPLKWFQLGMDGYLLTLDGNRALDSSNRSRSEFPTVYVPNGYIDVIYPQHLLDTGLLHGDSVRPFETPEVLEVDDAHALAVLRAMDAIPTSLRSALGVPTIEGGNAPGGFLTG